LKEEPRVPISTFYFLLNLQHPLAAHLLRRLSGNQSIGRLEGVNLVNMLTLSPLTHALLYSMEGWLEERSVSPPNLYISDSYRTYQINIYGSRNIPNAGIRKSVTGHLLTSLRFKSMVEVIYLLHLLIFCEFVRLLRNLYASPG
jgi:hypothetical protein